MIKRINSQTGLKRYNIGTVLNEIRHKKEIVKTQLAKNLNLSFATVSSICETLKTMGFITLEKHAEYSGGGRKPRKIIFKPDSRFIISLDLSMKESLSLALINLDGENADEQQFSGLSDEDLDSSLCTAEQAIHDICRNHGIEDHKVIGIGAAVPGVYDAVQDMVYYSTKPYLEGVHIRSKLELRFNKSVLIENDANLAALGQSMLSSQVCQNLILLYFTAGLGLGMVHRGKIFSGAHGFAGELGNICYPTEKGLERIEHIITRETMLKTYLFVLRHGRLPHITELSVIQLSDDDPSIEELAAACGAAAPEALQVLSYSSKILGWAVSALIDLLNPDSIYLGGNIDVLIPHMLPLVQEEVSKVSVLSKSIHAPIQAASDNNLIAVGSGELVYRSWLAKTFFVGHGQGQLHT